MRRTERAPRQLPLFPAADFTSPDDPVGAALGVVDGDPDEQWDLVMGMLSHMAWNAYYDNLAERGLSPEYWWLLVYT